MRRYQYIVLALFLVAANAFGHSPNLQLMGEEFLTGKRTFGFYVDSKEKIVLLNFHVVFYFKSGNIERGTRTSGFIEIDGKRVKTWIKKESVSLYGVPLSKGEHTVTLAVTSSDRAYVEWFVITADSRPRPVTEPSPVDSLWEVKSQKNELSTIKAEIRTLPKEQRLELLKWLQEYTKRE